jgi:AbrB family looped-hinge helix DNA binding protein
MSKVTSKLQVTIPKAIADAFGITPGDTLAWMPAGDGIRVVPGTRDDDGEATRRRLESFDAATRRQAERMRSPAVAPRTQKRGWSREELYSRGSAR